jgi:hypothetical protein
VTAEEVLQVVVGSRQIPFPGWWYPSGDKDRESDHRKTRMVEISLSGSGEGLGWATGRG